MSPGGGPRDHYDRLAGTWEDAFFYEPGPYQEWLVALVASRLDLGRDAALADLGCGTGSFTSALRERAGLLEPVLAVDESAASLERAARHPGLRPVRASLVDFARSPPAPLDRVLLKEVVHHLAPSQRPGIFAGLHGCLRPGGRVLVVTRPHEPRYPFFEAAARAWRAGQPDPATFAGELREAGFAVETTLHAFEVRLPRARWLAMLRARFWSMLAGFDDAEIERGLAEVAERFPQDPLRFTDDLVLISGRKD